MTEYVSMKKSPVSSGKTGLEDVILGQAPSGTAYGDYAQKGQKRIYRPGPNVYDPYRPGPNVYDPLVNYRDFKARTQGVINEDALHNQDEYVKRFAVAMEANKSAVAPQTYQPLTKKALEAKLKPQETSVYSRVTGFAKKLFSWGRK